TSGSISARTGSQTPSSKTTTRSSTPHARLGESSSLNPKRSPPSEGATGLTSVSRYDPWYNGWRPQLRDQPQDVGKESSRNGDFGHLESDIATMADDLR